LRIVRRGESVMAKGKKSGGKGQSEGRSQGQGGQSGKSSEAGQGNKGAKQGDRN